MSKKRIEVKVYESDSCEGVELPSSFDKLRQWVDEVEKSIPPEFRSSTYVRFEASDYYDGAHLISCCISYARLETDEEYTVRIEAERLRKQQEDESDWAHFLKLKQKFGDR